MNANQETFLREYLRTGDKSKAYQTAYPKAKESSLKNAANRLLQNNPEIAAAVNAKRAELYTQAEADAKAKMEADIMTQLEAKQLLTQTARGKRGSPKVWHTRKGFETHAIMPTHAQMLNAIRQLALMEGWYKKERAEKEKPEEEEPTSIKIYMNKLPWEEYNRISRNTLEAYYDPDGPTWRCHPDKNSNADKFYALQKKREEKRDAEREARMTPQLRLEEEQAMREFQNRPVDETDYQHHEKLVDDLVSEYSKAPETAKLETLTAIQNMCGLRFLHHRHRYEAEREAGWQFHPLNHALIRPADPKSQNPNPKQNSHSHQGRHFECNEKSPEPLQAAQSTEENQFQQPNRQQPTTNQSINPKSEIQNSKPDHHTLLKQGYTTLKELLQDEFDYYIKNQGSTTYKQLNDLKKFAAHRNAPPETRQQIEKETGWLYHPDDTNYAKRQPNNPLVRTKFPGPPTNWY